MLVTSQTLQQEWCIILIKEELRNRRFTNILDQLKMDTTACCSDLGRLILTLAGFNCGSDELDRWLFELIDDYADKFDLLDYSILNEQAINVYEELIKKRDLNA